MSVTVSTRTGAIAVHLPLLTVSSLKTWRRCQRLYRLRYDQGYRVLRDVEVLRFGSLIHAGLEAWLLGIRAGMSGDALLLHVLQGLPVVEDPYEQARAEALLCGYHYRWHEERLEVLAVEAEFRADLINPDTDAASRTWRLGGKLDAIVRTADGRTLIVEHKTSSEDISVGSDYWRRLRMDGQISAYYVGAQSLGYDVAGCLYDVIAKPTIRPLRATPLEARKYTTKAKTLYASQRDTDETVSEYRARLVEAIATEPYRYFARGEVVRLESEMHEHLVDVWQTAQSIRAGQVRNAAPRNPDACKAFGRTCEFLSVCLGEATLADGAFQQVENVHSELSIELPTPGTDERGVDHGHTGNIASP